MLDSKNPEKIIPKTINEKEREVLLFWQQNNIFKKSIKTPGGEVARGDFSFYDGPPFATGLPHYGHILAGTIKDAIPRYQTMQGKSVRRVWGWDCHGLPIENLIEKKVGLKSKKDIEEYGIDKFNHDAYESVLTYDREWKDVIPRLGRWVDMDRPYKTMDASYTESIWWAWKALHEKGLAYEGNKMMHICPRCETTLAQSEVGMNYQDITDLSVTAKFELIDEPGTYVLAWTTTPWTLPGNVALAINENNEYVKVSIKDMEGQYIIAQERIGEVLKGMEYSAIETMSGTILVGKSYKPVFSYFENVELDNKENIWKIWHADFITMDTGTGVAHQAPAFGQDDMDLAKLYKLPIIKHIKMDGTFIPIVTDFAGMKVKVAGDSQSADIEIIKNLAHKGLLFEKHKIIHSYPLCWRCKTPLLNYATSSWFVDVPKIKEKLIAENQKIGWVPAHTRDGRFGKWLEGAREWAVSRTRYWGAPLPVWKNEDGDMVMIGSLKELAEKNKHKAQNTYYVMRHGEANSNVNNVMDKGTDPNNHLTENGRLQVEEGAKTLSNKNIEIIVASPILRGKETAEIVAQHFGLPIIFDERLKEYDMGDYDGKSRKEFFASFDTSFVEFDARPEGGETHREMMHRSMAVIYDLEKKYEGKNILIVTHGGPARMLVAGAHLLTEEEVVADEISGNTALYPKNAEVKTFVPRMVPRDETGAINLHRPYIDTIELEIHGKTYKRIPDVFDCWFESGSMPFASIHYPFENKEIFDKNYPAEFIAEGVDQTRGWFYSLMNLGVGLFDNAPYKHVIVNGMMLADDGQKMSKSESNYTDPMILVEKYGADALRYALLSSPVVKGESLQFSDESISDVYKKCIVRLENVVSLYEMNKIDNIEAKDTSTHVLDRWIVSRMNEVIKDSTKGYENYILDEATRGISDIIDDISVWYTRRSRDRLKGDTGKEDQRLAYETFKYILLTLAKVMAPSMPFIAERIYKQLGGKKESVHLDVWPIAKAIDDEVLSVMKETRNIVSQALMERTKSKINVRQPLRALYITTKLPDEYVEIIKDEINVKEVLEGNEVSLDTVLTDELLKEGELRNLMRAIQDTRKEKGLSPKDIAVITLSVNESYFGHSFNEQLQMTCKLQKIIWNGLVKKNDENISFELIEI